MSTQKNTLKRLKTIHEGNINISINYPITSFHKNGRFDRTRKDFAIVQVCNVNCAWTSDDFDHAVLQTTQQNIAGQKIVAFNLNVAVGAI
jgi:uncharacterized protein YjbI with pentapeptide repeats